MAEGADVDGGTVPDGPMALHCFVKRREGMSHDEFLDYWRNHHGPLIRDTPELARWTKRYVQHAAHPKDSSGYDGVAVQEFASWDDFIAMITGPAGELMRISPNVSSGTSELRIGPQPRNCSPPGRVTATRSARNGNGGPDRGG